MINLEVKAPSISINKLLNQIQIYSSFILVELTACLHEILYHPKPHPAILKLYN
jgi:hypothetical protein